MSTDLDRLVLQLLAKQPQSRLGYAEDVARTLCRLGALPGASDRSLPRRYLYRPRFAGREAELQGLRSRVDALGKGQGGLVFIGGESGVGKTRLVMELARSSQRLPMLAGECTPVGTEASDASGGALSPVRAANWLTQLYRPPV